MLSDAELKSLEPYPVPLARILMAADALQHYSPHPGLPAIIAQHREWLIAKIQTDEQTSQGYFGPAAQRWSRDDRNLALGVPGHSLNVFTGGSVLRSLVRSDTAASRMEEDPFPALLRNGLIRCMMIVHWNATDGLQK